MAARTPSYREAEEQGRVPLYQNRTSVGGTTTYRERISCPQFLHAFLCLGLFLASMVTLGRIQWCVFVAIHSFFVSSRCDAGASWRSRAGWIFVPNIRWGMFKRERAAVIIVISVVVDAIGKNDSGPAVVQNPGPCGW